MPNLRQRFNVRPDHEAGRIHQAHDGQPVRVAQLHEASGFVGGIGVDRATQVQRVVGHEAHWPPRDARQRGVYAHAKTSAQMQKTAFIGNALHGGACVVHAQAVFGHHVAQGLCRRRLPFGWRALKTRQVMTRGSHRLRFVVHQDVDHPVAVLHAAGANLLGLEHAQAPAFDHGRSTHADVAADSGDDHVAATQQGGVARKAAPCHHAHHRHLAIEPRKRGKGGQVQARHDGHIHITGPAAAAFGEQHHGQLVLQSHAQHAVGLLVVAHALRARQHGEVVGHDHHALAVHATDARDHAVCWGVAHQIVGAAAAALRGHSQCAVFDKRIGIAQVGNVFAGGSQPHGVALGHGFGACRVVGEGQAGLQLLQVGALL